MWKSRVFNEKNTFLFQISMIFFQKKYELMEIIESFEICITILLKNSGFVLQNDTLFQEKSDFTLFVKTFDDL